MESLQWARIGRIGDRFADLDIGESRNADNFARAGFWNLHALNPLWQGKAGNGTRHGTLIANDGDLCPLTNNAVANAPNSDAAHKVVRCKVGDQHLQRVTRLMHRCWCSLKHAVQQWDQVGARLLHVARGGAGARICVDDGEVDLLLIRTEVEEELVNLVDHLLDARVWAVDLVDDEDDGE